MNGRRHQIAERQSLRFETDTRRENLLLSTWKTMKLLNIRLFNEELGPQKNCGFPRVAPGVTALEGRRSRSAAADSIWSHGRYRSRAYKAYSRHYKRVFAQKSTYSKIIIYFYSTPSLSHAVEHCFNWRYLRAIAWVFFIWYLRPLLIYEKFASQEAPVNSIVAFSASAISRSFRFWRIALRSWVQVKRRAGHFSSAGTQYVSQNASSEENVWNSCTIIWIS